MSCHMPARELGQEGLDPCVCSRSSPVSRHESHSRSTGSRGRAVVEAVFGTFIWPLLGLIFLPFTTLMYTILWTPGVGVTGWDWLWIAFAFVLDLGHYGYSAYGNRGHPGGCSATEPTGRIPT